MTSVSVLMCAHNVAPFAAEAMTSVLLQKHRDLQIVIVNDGSSDTRELDNAISPFEKYITYLKQPHRGIAAARNSGIAACQGEVVAILDPDDIWEPDYLRVQLGTLEANPGAAVVYSNATYVGATHLNGALYADFYPSRGPVTFESVCLGSCNIFSPALIRREALLAAARDTGGDTGGDAGGDTGVYDETLTGGWEGLDLYLRMLLAGHQIVYHSHPVYRVRPRPGDHLTGDAARRAGALAQMLVKIEETHWLTASQKRALHERLKRVRGRLALHAGTAALMAGEWSRAHAVLRDASQKDGTFALNLATWATALSPQTVSRIVRWHYARQPNAQTWIG